MIVSPAPFAAPSESPVGPAQPLRWRWLAPSWLISAVVHALLILTLGYVAEKELHGTNGPPFGELLASSTNAPDESELFADEGSVTLETASEPSLPDAADGMETSGGAMSDVISDEPPVDTSSALPAAHELAGLGTGEEGPATGAGQLTGGPRRTTKVAGGLARTSVYGIEGEGNRFVYVFDRSASMGSGTGSPLASAKRELLASLAELSETNQFQIIFYNERPAAMNLGRQYGGLLFADRQSQELAEKYVRGIMADGGTRHGEAIEAALVLSPDVIFFLTDADQPELSADRLARIKRMNAGRASIHTIEFGLGAQPARDNFLAKIARQNGGKYVYIDISAQGALKLRAARD